MFPVSYTWTFSILPLLFTHNPLFHCGHASYLSVCLVYSNYYVSPLKKKRWVFWFLIFYLYTTKAIDYVNKKHCVLVWIKCYFTADCKFEQGLFYSYFLFSIDDLCIFYLPILQDYLTPLHVASHCGNVRTAKLLLDRKCNSNARALVSMIHLIGLKV